MTADAAPASPLPKLKPCPACGASGRFCTRDYGEWTVECDSAPVAEGWTCWRGPFRDSYSKAADAWNALPRLGDGLRPEAPASVDTAASVAWIVRALPILAERLGVRLPPFPRRPT